MCEVVDEKEEENEKKRRESLIPTLSTSKRSEVKKMNPKPYVVCKICGLPIPKRKRREHLEKVHKILVGVKGWIRKYFDKRKWKYGWKKPAVIEID